jgi:hypothetical protein
MPRRSYDSQERERIPLMERYNELAAIEQLNLLRGMKLAGDASRELAKLRKQLQEIAKKPRKARCAFCRKPCDLTKHHRTFTVTAGTDYNAPEGDYEVAQQFLPMTQLALEQGLAGDVVLLRPPDTGHFVACSKCLEFTGEYLAEQDVPLPEDVPQQVPPAPEGAPPPRAGGERYPEDVPALPTRKARSKK